MVHRIGKAFLLTMLLCSSDLVLTVDKRSTVNSSAVINARIDLEARGDSISKYHYGMFIEHLGNVDVGDLIDDGIWAELLDDRKFFYPIDTLSVLEPVNKRDSINQWWPIGDPGSVVMDSFNTYVGVHSPRITVTPIEPGGIYQPGLTLQGNRDYTGRVVISGDPGIKVEVRLVWGEGDNLSDVMELQPLSREFSTIRFNLQCQAYTNNGKLEIIGSGDGEFRVGAVSLMPEDHLDGFRPEAIRLLRDLNSGIYRWGGNMSSGYDWRDGIGDPDLRPPRYEYAWEGMENNDVGTHELIRFAQLIGVELNLTVNTGFGDAHTAAQWVEYVNGASDTPMGRLRAQNGHPEPFNLKLWCVGNEAYGWWQLGHTDLRNHIIKHNIFAEKMLEKDSTIKLVASGASLEEMTITLSAKALTGHIQAQYDSASDWTGGLLRYGKHIDYISEHFYCAVDQRFDLEAGVYVEVEEPLVDWTRRPANRIKAKAQHYAEYHRRIPGSKEIPVYLDEWAYWTNWVHSTPTLGVTIGYARALHEIFRHTDLIRMVGFTFGTSCLSFNDADVIYNSTGLMYHLYRSAIGEGIPVRVSGDAPQPPPKWPVGAGQPLQNAGGNSYPLDVVAVITDHGNTLAIAVVNPTEEPQQLSLSFINGQLSDQVKKWTISGTSVEAVNIVGREPEVEVAEHTISHDNILIFDAATINVLNYEIL